MLYREDDFLNAIHVKNGIKRHPDKISAEVYADGLLQNYYRDLCSVKEKDYIYFGHYYLPNTFKPMEYKVRMPIKWRILKKEGSKLLLLSEYCLDWEGFNGDALLGIWNENNSWEDSMIRKLLNEVRINEWFSESERKIIRKTHISDSINPQNQLTSGKETKDKLFLLGAEEFPDWFDRGTSMLMVDKTKESELFIMDGGSFAWWLRTPGDEEGEWAVCWNDGCIDLHGEQSHADEICIRPAMWIDIELIKEVFNNIKNDTDDNDMPSKSWT